MTKRESLKQKQYMRKIRSKGAAKAKANFQKNLRTKEDRAANRTNVQLLKVAAKASTILKASEKKVTPIADLVAEVDLISKKKSKLTYSQRLAIMAEARERKDEAVQYFDSKE